MIKMTKTYEKKIQDKKQDIIKLIISGRVQGVGYRYSTRSKADILGLKGYVKNNHDSTVEILAIGKKENIKELIDWCKNNSPGRVDNIDTIRYPKEEEKDIKKFSTFSIRY